MPRVAVLMVVVDADPPDFLRRAIDSLLVQSYDALDIHVLTSGPLRNELDDLLRRYADQCSRVLLHARPETQPLGVNLNDLIVRVRDRYDYFARMDPDDEALPGRIAAQVAFMEAYPKIDIVGGAIIDVDERGNELKVVRYPLVHEEIVRFFRKRTPVAHPAVLFRRTYFEKAGLYPTPPGPLEDGLYWMAGILAGCRFANLPQPLVRLRRTDALLRRRSGLRHTWAELRIRLRINRALGFGPSAYWYGAAMFVVQLLPLRLRHRLYERFR